MRGLRDGVERGVGEGAGGVKVAGRWFARVAQSRRYCRMYPRNLRGGSSTSGSGGNGGGRAAEVREGLAYAAELLVAHGPSLARYRWVRTGA